MSGGRRRIDKVLADDFIADLEKIDIGDLRERRLEAEQEEADLSYVRRMLQGRCGSAKPARQPEPLRQRWLKRNGQCRCGVRLRRDRQRQVLPGLQ